MANHGPYWHTASPKSYGKLTPQVPEMLGGFYLWIHESTHFFLQATWRDLTLIPPSKYSESSEKLKAPFFFPSKKKCSTLSLLFSFIYPQPSKALRFPWPTPIHLLAQPNACFNSSQAVGSPGKTRTTSGERPMLFWKSRVLCKKIGSWNPESIRIHYCHALGESKQQYLGIMAGHMCGKRICL